MNEEVLSPEEMLRDRITDEVIANTAVREANKADVNRDWEYRVYCIAEEEINKHDTSVNFDQIVEKITTMFLKKL